MTVGPDRRGAGRGTHMREKQGAANLMGDREQVLIAPGGPHIAEQAWPLAFAVPADPEAIGVDLGFRLAAVPALRDEALTRLRDEVLEKDRLAEIRQPAAHVLAQGRVWKGGRWERMRAVRDPVMHLPDHAACRGLEQARNDRVHEGCQTGAEQARRKA